MILGKLYDENLRHFFYHDWANPDMEIHRPYEGIPGSHEPLRKYARYGLRFPSPTAKSAFVRHDLSTAIKKSGYIVYYSKITV